MIIRNVVPDDAQMLADIYNYYILNTIITFEEAPVTANEMKKRISDPTLKFPWIVYEMENQVLGFAYASEWKSRCAYKHSAEVTIYLKHEETGKGIGSDLYTELFKRLKPFNLHALIGGIALPNEASVAIHEKLGFEKVAQFKEVGFKFGKWIDVGYWELIIKD